MLHSKLDDESIHWLQINFLKTELELGHSLRLPAEGPCKCDLVLNWPQVPHTIEYAPGSVHGWTRNRTWSLTQSPAAGTVNFERHEATSRRLRQLLTELDDR